VIERLVLLLASWAGVTVGQPGAPQVKNELTGCVQIVLYDPERHQNLLLVPAQLTVSRSIGACGCTSGGIRYRAYETVQGRQRQMNSGVLNTIPRVGKPTEVLLVLNPDIEVYRTPPYRVVLSCEE
jgi:hypothetical protein